MEHRAYKIPATLDMSYFDMEFTFRSKSGVSMRPISGKTVGFILASVILWMFMVFSTFIKSGGFFLIVCFTLLWASCTFLLLRNDETKRFGVELIIPLVNYLPRKSRYVSVRSLDDVGSLQYLYGISDVDEADAMIYYQDGTIGYVYQVVGSASVLMFDSDKIEILNNVSKFYEKLPMNVELIYDTVKESQRVDRQLAYLEERYDSFKKVSTSPGLNYLFNEQYDFLKIGVGSQFKSLHQYMIVKAPNQDLLTEFESILKSTVENDGVMFKYARSLTYDETVDYFKGLYSSI